MQNTYFLFYILNAFTKYYFAFPFKWFFTPIFYLKIQNAIYQIIRRETTDI